MWFEITEALQDLFVRYPNHSLVNANSSTTTTNASTSTNQPWNLKVPNKDFIDSDKTARQILDTYLNAMRMISMLLKHMPAYVWLISYSLLISGCVQRNKDVEELIGRIILKVLQQYPQQAIWHIFPLNYSNSEDRKQKYTWIRKQTSAHSYKVGDSSLYQFFDEAAALAHQFTVLCAHKVPKDKGNANIELNLADTCMIEQRIPKELIMPSEQQLSCVQFLDASKDPKNPFAYQPVYIRRAHPKVQILKSLAKPRKIILYGSDEAEYWFLCKPVDDLRKDARMMEFSAMVNRLLKKDLETRRRELRIRTYAVLPLSDNSGILSWVPNTNGLRGIISDMYAMDGLDLTEKIREIRKPWESNQAKDEWEAQYIEKILPKFPLALSKWFLQNFTEPSLWLRARTNFARTCGVMSVVGTILGLGDRHCENILIDSKNGDCLHVDLNCIFHKGRSFAIPECVPFRLTRNMVDAFGITGFEGAFRKACEYTMMIMRQNKDALISVLGTFVHDPLLEWSNETPSSSSATTTRHQLQLQQQQQQQQQQLLLQQQQQQQQQTSGAKSHPSSAAPDSIPGYSHERHNKLAVEILNGITDRLNGLMRTPDNLDQLIVPLSVEGYVDAIISEATSTANLCKMYVGWSSFI
jgi:serine/threonine-protein kinase ATR